MIDALIESVGAVIAALVGGVFLLKSTKTHPTDASSKSSKPVTIPTKNSPIPLLPEQSKSVARYEAAVEIPAKKTHIDAETGLIIAVDYILTFATRKYDCVFRYTPPRDHQTTARARHGDHFEFLSKGRRFALIVEDVDPALNKVRFRLIEDEEQ